MRQLDSKEFQDFRSLSPEQSPERYDVLFLKDGRYVFDGNRVTASYRVSRNGVGWWRLLTADPNLSFLVTPDLRIRRYQRTGNKCVVRVVRGFDSVFDAALKPLGETIEICEHQRHTWSPASSDVGSGSEHLWRWCLVCGAERLSFLSMDHWLIWPDDADEIVARIGRVMPRLHGPVVGGAI